jgi:DNA-binding NarL/FixJ family response regulator
MKDKIINVMIVDDHQIMIDGIYSMLANEPDISIIQYANNGKQAIIMLEETTVDVVIMDIEMPIMNGIDATKHITANFPAIKIIALTTYDEKSIINAMLEAGATGYILKNINKEILVQAIKTVADGKNYYGTDITIAMAKNVLGKSTTNTLKEEQIISSLSPREIDILKNIVNGLSNKEIGEKLFISPKTVDTHRNNIMKKLDVHNTASLVKFAIKIGLVD